MSARTSEQQVAAQHAFVGLLAQPMITPATNRELFRLVVRHQQPLSEAARRFGYRIQRVGQAARLIRVPVGGTATVPPRPSDAPSRRLLALMCLIAACCEEVSGTVTLQRLSDMVRDVCAAPGVQVSPYDPDIKSERRQLRDAAALLARWGVLNRRTSDEKMLEEWTEDGSGPGAGYEVDRDALLLMTSPDVLAAALQPEPADADATRTIRLLRALVETPAVLYADLDPTDADTLRRHRSRYAGYLAQMTGGAIEARQEGILLVLRDGDGRPPTVADWPRARAADWVALLAADQAGRDGVRHDDGTVHLTRVLVDELIDDLIRSRGAYMNDRQKADPQVVLDDAQRVLTELGLLRVTGDGGWVLLPPAARYRDPDVLYPETTSRTSSAADLTVVGIA